MSEITKLGNQKQNNLLSEFIFQRAYRAVFLSALDTILTGIQPLSTLNFFQKYKKAALLKPSVRVT